VLADLIAWEFRASVAIRPSLHEGAATLSGSAIGNGQWNGVPVVNRGDRL